MSTNSSASAEQRSGILGRIARVAFISIFIAGFIVLPMIVGGFAFNSVFKWWDARDWAPVQATVLEAKLNVSRGSESTTYQVRARYRYRFNGQTHESDQVDFHSASDNIGDYHQQTYRVLETARESGQSVTAWVDPEDPSRAVLHRDVRWGLFGFMLMFPLVFGGVALALVFGWRAARRRKQKASAAREAHPDAPWRWRERWTSKTLSSRSRNAVWVSIGFAVLWNAVSIPLAFVVPGEVADGNLMALIMLLFPLVGAGLIVWAGREVIRRRRYGDSLLHLDRLPVPLGGILRARLEVPARLQASDIHVHLSCVRRVRSGHGKNRKTREHLLWEDSVRVMAGSGGQPGGTSARIEARLPQDRPQASEEDRDNRIIWRLEATSEEPGVDYKAGFELPVFDTGETDVALESRGSDVGLDSSDDDWRDTGVIHGYAGGGQRFYFPRFRLLSGGLTTLLFAIVFLGSGLGLAVGAGHLVFGGVFTLIGALILWGAISMLFQRSEIIIGAGRLRWRHGIFSGWQELETGAVKEMRIEKAGSFGRKLYYRLELDAWGAGDASTLANWVPNERAADALANHLAQMAGIEIPGTRRD